MRARFVVYVCLCLPLLACQPRKAELAEAPVYDQNYPIIVRPGRVLLELEASRGALSPADENAVGLLAERAIEVRPASIIIEHPPGAKGDAAALRVSRILINSGVDAASLHAQPAKWQHVRVSFADAIATTRACGLWDGKVMMGYDNRLPDEFGCATQHNLAAMVANAQDLAVPRAMPPRRYLLSTSPLSSDLQTQAPTADTSKGR